MHVHRLNTHTEILLGLLTVKPKVSSMGSRNSKALSGLSVHLLVHIKPIFPLLSSLTVEVININESFLRVNSS